MKNDIPTKQNSESFLEYLAASSYLYGKAKVYLGCQIFLIVVIGVAFAIITIFEPDLKIWAVTYGISFSIIDALILESKQKKDKQDAAKIQELFDCGLFTLEWRQSKIGNKPGVELLSASAKKYKGNPKKDWYSSEVGKLPLHQAIVVCQRSNCWWDSDLRKRYNEWIRGILIIAILTTVVIGIANQLSVPDLILSVFAPISPAILWTIREHKKQKETCNTLDKLKNHAETLLEKAKKSTLSPDEIKTEARFLQDELYDHRRNCPLIFDWVYSLLRNEQEEQMNKSVEKLVEDFLQN